MNKLFFPKFLLRLLIRFGETILGAFRYNNRRLLESIGNLLDCPRYLPVSRLLPPISLETLVADETAIEIYSLERRNGNISALELAAICKIVRQKQPKKIFEIGTFDGRTTLNMAANAKEAIVYTLDLPESYVAQTKLQIEKGDRIYIIKNECGTCFQGTRYMNRIIQLYGDSADFDFSDWYRVTDFVFVDGSHSYEYVMNDAQIALKLVRPDGVILFHDYGGTWSGVNLALEQLFLTNQHFRDLKHIEGTSFAILDLSKRRLSEVI